MRSRRSKGARGECRLRADRAVRTLLRRCRRLGVPADVTKRRLRLAYFRIRGTVTRWTWYAAIHEQLGCHLRDFDGWVDPRQLKLPFPSPPTPEAPAACRPPPT